MRRLLFPLILGAGGIAILLNLGFWQIQRLAWKEGVLAEIETKIAAAPVAIPADPTEASDEYRAVTFSGDLSEKELHVLVSGTAAGTGYRVISPIKLADGRSALLDLGLLPLEAKASPGPGGTVAGRGNLLWPDDVNTSTPEPDFEKNIWFGRDVDAMADTLGTDPILIVVSEIAPTDPRLTPLPVDTSTIKNDHREYAITWFLLAVVWAAMTVYWVLRTTRPKDT